MIIAAKIDVTKITKDRLFPGKNGAKYLDVILIETPNNPYGNDFMVQESVTKEEREAGKKGPVLGNAKIIGVRLDQQARPSRPTASQATQADTNDNIPF